MDRPRGLMSYQDYLYPTFFYLPSTTENWVPSFCNKLGQITSQHQNLGFFSYLLCHRLNILYKWHDLRKHGFQKETNILS